MMQRMSLAMAVILAASSCAQTSAPAPPGMPATQPVAAASGPATAPAVDPEVADILAKLEAAGEKFKTLRADIEYRTNNPDLGLQEIRTGWVAYSRAGKDSPARFRIHFETLQQSEGPKRRQKVDYSFNGQWLTEAKHAVRIMTRYQLAADGGKVAPMRLGKGPFPLPFGQKTADVLEYFHATTRPAADDDPENTVFLHLLTREERRGDLSLVELDIWIDRTTGLPGKIRSTDKSKNVTAVTFTAVKTDRTFTDDIFHLPKRPGWEYRVEPLKNRPAARAMKD